MGLASIIGWIVFGFIVGLLGRLLVPGRQPLGFIGTTLLGIAGSFAGGYLGSLFGGAGGPSASWIMSSIGAAIVLAIYLFFARRAK
ncbi:MAG: GlsB/YeaQ/YmgE family stress response membrane protein [Planctomycetaceae bacterium]|nr:GlsB/YeaQ/YmgE family stress response membrane protein [Planctomycetaceae bacterium]MCA9112013.1 GlsB/YeaQ/YmgE family stress response membrane protein [Planctomycetaceae bacterium]